MQQKGTPKRAFFLFLRENYSSSATFLVTAFICAAVVMHVLLFPQMAAVIMMLIMAVSFTGRRYLRQSWLRLSLSVILAADDHAGCRAHRRSHHRTIIAAHCLPDHAARNCTHYSAHHRTGVRGKCRGGGEQQSCQ